MKDGNAVIETREMNEEELSGLLREKKELEEINRQADMNAKSDAVSEDNEEEIKEIDYVVNLKKSYDFNGKKINKVDMSGLEELTTLDAQEVDREMAMLNHYPKAKFRDTLYRKHVAMRATGLPVDFFNMLGWRDAEEVLSTVTWYFLFG